MKNKIFMSIPFFDIIKIKTQVLDLLCMNITKYYNEEHVNIIVKEIEQYINEKVFVKNLISIRCFNKKGCDKNVQNFNTSFSKALICIKSAKKGGVMVIFNKATKNKKVVYPSSNHIILLNPLSYYTISKVNRGSVIMMVLDIDIPSMRIMYKSINNVKYSNVLSLLFPFFKNEFVFALKQLIDINNNQVLCEQIVINREYYTVISTNLKKFYIPSICFGKKIIDFNYGYDDFNEDIINKIINSDTPFDFISPQKSIIDASLVYEKVIYGKINV
ncbi:hypothetical protein [Sheeppox virus]|uniref:Uncharacterized protein n=1 Tax=Sheeppox virus TaxID=10266 RepID=A0A2P1A981_SHEV|nr:hypothetical protein [Sheeppox virus]